MCRRLTPLTDVNAIRLALQETSDAEMRIIAKGSISFSGVKDVRGSVKRLEVGSACSLSIPRVVWY